MARDKKEERALCYRQLNRRALRGQIVLAGSSVCEQFPINEMLMSRGAALTVYNRGISGDVMDGYAKKLSDCVLDLAPGKLFINIGSNDMNTAAFSPDAHIRRYESMLQTVRNALPACQIFVLSYYPVNPDMGAALGNPEVYLNRTNALINRVNARLAEMCARFPCGFINVHDTLLDASGALRADFTLDGMHLYPEAYERVLDILLPYMV